MKRGLLQVVAAAGLCVGAALVHADVALPSSPTLAKLQADFPGVQVSTNAAGKVTVFGRSMNDAPAPSIASNNWLHQYGPALGAGPLTLDLAETREINSGRLNSFIYRQWLGDLPVERGEVRVVVATTASAAGPDLVHRVVLVSATVATTPEGGFPADVLSAQDAIARVQKLPRFGTLDRWDEPTMVIYTGAGELMDHISPARAWKFVASCSDSANPAAFTFFVDAATGTLLHARPEVHQLDITGSVVGLFSPPNRPDVATNPAVETGAKEVKVSVQGSSPAVFAYTDRSGNFTIPWTGTDPVTLQVGVEGRWGAVDNLAGAEISVTSPATPGTPVVININPTSTQATTAQMNALVNQSITHNFFRDRSGTWDAVDSLIPAVVMEASSCNAYFSTTPISTHYYSVGGGCVNAAYASVINHEYGHYIVNRLGRVQGSFGEGFADCLSLFINDDPIIGREFGLPPNGWVREISFTQGGAAHNFPCNGGEFHFCGEILANIWWNTREGFGTRYGSAMGLDLSRQLFVDWALIATDPNTGESADLQTATEVLTADDDDATLENGTPNYPQIANAFSARNIALPCVEFRANISPQASLPSIIQTSSQPLSVPVHVADGNENIVPGSVMLRHRIGNSGTFLSTPMTAGANPGDFIATLPTIPCGQSLQYYYQLSTTQGSTITMPGVCSPGISFYTVTAADTSIDQLEDFDPAPSPAGWATVPGSRGTIVEAQFAGRWTYSSPFGPPNGPITVPSADYSVAPGINCYHTGRGTDNNPDTADVDGGHTTLQSATYDLSAVSDATFSYARWWYSNGPGTGTLQDRFIVEVSNDNGATWTTAESLAEGVQGTQWQIGGFSLSALGLAPTATVKLRFVAMDLGPLTIVEAAIDDVRVTAINCSTPTGCDSIDFNNDGLFPDTNDIDTFLSVFAGNPCPTTSCNDIDFNNDGLFPDTSDIDAFLRVFAGGAC